MYVMYAQAQKRESFRFTRRPSVCNITSSGWILGIWNAPQLTLQWQQFG